MYLALLLHCRLAPDWAERLYSPRFLPRCTSCLEDLGRIPRTLIIPFPQPFCRLLNLIFQGSLSRFRDLEREKLTSARLAEIGVRELFLKASSGSGEFCVQGFLDSFVFVIILRSEGKTTLGSVKSGVVAL
jgi:hypothetical protein